MNNLKTKRYREHMKIQIKRKLEWVYYRILTSKQVILAGIKKNNT